MAPRVSFDSFGWDVFGNSRMVIRAGGGIYYDRFQGNRVFDFVRNLRKRFNPL